MAIISFFLVIKSGWYIFRAAALELHAAFIWWSMPFHVVAPGLLLVTVATLALARRIGNLFPGAEFIVFASSAMHLVLLIQSLTGLDSSK